MLEGRSASAARLEVRLEVSFAARLNVLPANFPCVDFCLNGFVATGSPPSKLRVANANRPSCANPALRVCARTCARYSGLIGNAIHTIRPDRLVGISYAAIFTARENAMNPW